MDKNCTIRPIHMFLCSCLKDMASQIGKCAHVVVNANQPVI